MKDTNQVDVSTKIEKDLADKVQGTLGGSQVVATMVDSSEPPIINGHQVKRVYKPDDK